MRGQRGFLLLELALAALVAGLLALWASQALVGRVSDAQADAVAAWMGQIQRAAQHYLDRHAAQLREGGPAGLLAGEGYAHWQSPGLDELRAAGLLPSGFPLALRPVGSAAVFIVRDAGCPGPPCFLLPVVYSSQPLLRPGGTQVDEAMLARWLLASQGRGAAVQPDRPGQVQGPAVVYPNPLPGGPLLAPGTVVLGLAGAHPEFLRVGDPRDPQFQANASVAGTVYAGESLHAQKYLFPGAGGAWWTLCPEEGAVGRDERGGLLVCHAGFWKPAVRSSGGFSLNSKFGCFTPEGRSSANPATRACSCPLGAAVVPFSEGGDPSSPRGVTQGYLCVD